MTLNTTMKAAEEGKEEPYISIVYAGVVEGSTRVNGFPFPRRDWVHAAAEPQERHLLRGPKPQRLLGPGQPNLWTFLLRTNGYQLLTFPN